MKKLDGSTVVSPGRPVVNLLTEAKLIEIASGTEAMRAVAKREGVGLASIWAWRKLWRALQNANRLK